MPESKRAYSLTLSVSFASLHMYNLCYTASFKHKIIAQYSYFIIIRSIEERKDCVIISACYTLYKRCKSAIRTTFMVDNSLPYLPVSLSVRVSSLMSPAGLCCVMRRCTNHADTEPAIGHNMSTFVAGTVPATNPPTLP